MPIEEKPVPAEMESAVTHPKASSSALEKSISKMSVRSKESEAAAASLSLPSILSEEPQPSTSVAASFRSISGGAKRKVLKRKVLKKEKKPPKKPQVRFASRSRKRFQYDLSLISQTLEAIQGGMSVRTACDKFQVPRTTIRNKLANKAPMVSTGHCGPVSLLGEEIEDMLVDWMIGCADMGFVISKEDLLSSVKKLLDEKNIESIHFTNNRPGRRWYEGFFKRHPVLEEKQKEERSLSGTKRPVSEDEVKEWFQKVNNSLGKNVDVLNHPDRVFCMDEIFFSLMPPDDPLSDKENVSTFFVVDAEGNLVPPLTLFKIGRVPQTAPPNWHVGETEKGLMTGESLYEYFIYIFQQYLNNSNIIRPVVVFLDGRKSHLTFHLSKFCWGENIILIALPPNSTEILQPLDASLFGPIKKVFKRLLRGKSKTINDVDVPVVLFKLVSDARIKNNIVSGFAETGIFPFDDSKVDYSKCSVIAPINQVKTSIEISPEEREFIEGFSSSNANKQTKTNDGKLIIRPYVHNNSESSSSMHESSSEEMDDTEQSQTHEVNEPAKKIEVYKYLQFMESRIEPSSLYEFKRTLFNRQEWNGNPHDFSLFQLWKQVTEEAMTPEVQDKNRPIQIPEIHSCQ